MNEVDSIVCAGLCKTFSDGVLRVEVLKGVDLTVKKGCCLAIVGSSGSGKSTLLHLLGGLDDPTAGEVRVAGQSMSSLSERDKGRLRNRALGFIYQFHHLLPEFSAIENVAMPLLIRGISVAEAKRASAEVLNKVGLAHRLQHKPGELSGGERQRAAIARALITRPQCILADEPTGNLDEKTANQVFEVMLKLNKEYNISLVMATHNLALAKRMASILELRDGSLQ